MKSPRQLVFGGYVGEAQPGALSRPAVGGRETLAGIALLVLFVSTDRLSIVVGGFNLRLELLAGGLLALWFFARSRGEVLQRLSVVEYALLGWLAANVFSSLVFSPSPQDSLKNAVIIAGVLTIYLAGLMIFTSAQAIKWAAIAWVIVGSVVSIIGLVEAFLYTFLGSATGISLERAYNDGVFVLTPRVQSTVWEPNIFGSYAMTVAMLAMCMSMSPEFSSPRRQAWLRFAVGCAFCGIMLSMTRTVWVMGPLLAAVLILFSLKHRLATPGQVVRGMLLPAGVGLVLGLAVGNFLIPTLHWQRDNPWGLTYEQVERAVPYLIKGEAPPPEIANPPNPPSSTEGNPQAEATVVPVPSSGQGSSTDVGTPGPAATPIAVSSGSTFIDKLRELLSPGDAPSVQGRLSIFNSAVEGWQKQPLFGWGSGSYPLLYPPDYTGAYWIANLELHILFDTGIVGLVLFAIPLVVVARRGWRALRNTGRDWDITHFILLGLLIGGAGLLLAYQVTEATWMGLTWAFFALLVMAIRVVSLGAPSRLETDADR